MRIYSVNNSNDCKVRFNSCMSQYSPNGIKNYKKIFSKEVIKNNTSLFRTDLNWKLLSKYVIQHFSDIPKVNTYVLACSDGSEACSFAIALMELLPRKLFAKFLPIHASDIDPNVINTARMGILNLFDEELMDSMFKDFKPKKYFSDMGVPAFQPRRDIKKTNVFPPEECINMHSYTMGNDLFNSIEFKQSDILTELSQIKDNGNTIVMCRNVFPYLDEKYADAVVAMASAVLKKGSIFVTGNYDSQTDLYKKLLNAGFYRPFENMCNIYQKL